MEPSDLNNVIGIPWFRNETIYRAFNELLTDKASRSSYSLWKDEANQSYINLTRAGGIVLKIEETPDEFRLWCQVNAKEMNSRTLDAFADAKALDKIISSR